ncbi:MAG: hypothetical protein ACLVJO_02730 [[Clostridium] scindens]
MDHRQQVWAPSAIPCPVKKALPHEMTTQEVEEMVEKFGDAALRAKKAGFDGVQIHGGHGYLVCEFASAYSNKRIDKYGGNLVNRMRFPVEIIQNIRRKCGEDFGVDYKISGEECAPAEPILRIPRPWRSCWKKRGSIRLTCPSASMRPGICRCLRQ